MSYQSKPLPHFQIFRIVGKEGRMVHKRAVVAMLTAAIFASGAPVKAACGWYLLQPPLLENPPTVEEILRQSPQWRGMSDAELRDIRAMAMLDRDAPLGRWTHKGSYDTAVACEKARQRLMDLAEAREPELRRDFPDGLPRLGIELAAASRCISPEDPRLTLR